MDRYALGTFIGLIPLLIALGITWSEMPPIDRAA